MFTPSARILVIEDEPVLKETLAYNLSRQGYQVVSAADGKAGIEKAIRLPADLVLLDLMLPKIDGWEVCRQIRKVSNIPILILTARDTEQDRVLGLELGADDYVCKPFNMRELMARVKAQLRRVQFDQEESGSSTGSLPTGQLIQSGNLDIDLVRHEVRLDGLPLTLKPKEFDLLVFLAHNHKKALSRGLILQQVWGWDFSGNTRTVDVHMSWLREKIETDPQTPIRIVTVRGAGYRFEG